jgi:hypothetical protein
MSKRFEHASRFLRGNSAISALLPGIERNAELVRVVRSILPPPLADHCLHASFDENTLVLVTASPVWATRLRFFAPELLRSLPESWGYAASCRIRIQPSSEPHRERGAESRSSRLTQSTVAHLLDAAESVKDEEIAAAFRRLAKAGAGSDQAVAAKGRM